jgi:hypothetical protein
LKPKRIIFAACSVPAFVDMAVNLRRDLGWEPCYWIGRPRVLPRLDAEFPAAVFHDHGDAIWARPPDACAGLDLLPLDEGLLEQLALCESIVLRMMDRIDYATVLNHADRRKLYYAHLRYWSAVIDHYRPDVLFNASTPHQIYDFVLQELCRLRGVRLVMFGLGFDLNLLFCKDDYREGSGRIGALCAARLAAGEACSVKLSADIEARLARIGRSYDEAIPALVANQLKDDDHQSAIFNLKRVTKAVLQTLRLGFRMVAGALSADPAGWKRTEAAKRYWVEWIYRELTGPLRLFKLKRYYRQLARPVDLSQPYIYLPLAYQPELSSSPEGGVFVEQLLMADLLSRAAPPGWLIFIKEHPIQFTYSLGTNRLVRSHEFYDGLKSLPNVRLVPLETVPFALIDNARAVATVTGTSGWEAMIRGKPVMHFGYPWWQGCPGSFHTPDLQSCRGALSLIVGGFVPDPAGLREFALVSQEEGCSGDVYWDRSIQMLSAAENPRVAEIAAQMAALIVRDAAREERTS